MTDNHRFIIVGAGGVGSWLAEGLVRMLEYKAPGSMLVIVDGDNFETKNKERQNFKGAGNKAEVLAAEIQPEFPNTMVIPLAQWVVPEVVEIEEVEGEVDDVVAGQIAATDLLSNGDIVYAVVDNFKCRKDLCDAARNFDDIDIFLGGNDDALFGSVYHYRRRDGKDITDHPSEWNDELINPPDRNPGEMNCAERAKIEGGTQFIATNFAVAAWLLGRTQHLILSDGEVVVNDTFFDLAIGKADSFDRRTVDAETLVSA